MNFDLIDKKLDSFIKYQRAMISSARRDYTILTLLVMIIALVIVIFFKVYVHHENVTGSDILPFALIFPGPIILGLTVSFLSYSRNKNRSVSFDGNCMTSTGKKYGHESIWFIEIFGPYVMNIQMRGLAGFRFVSSDVNRNKVILEEIKKIKPDIQIKCHIMGKIV